MMENEFENLKTDTLAKMVLTENCCAFCCSSYKVIIKNEEFTCCGKPEALEEGILAFTDDGFENSTRVYFTCKYFQKQEDDPYIIQQAPNGATTINLNPNHGRKVYNTSIPVDENVVDTARFWASSLETLKRVEDLKTENIEEAKEIYGKNHEYMIKNLADKKPIECDPQIDISEALEVYKMAGDIDASNIPAGRIFVKDEENPYGKCE